MAACRNSIETWNTQICKSDVKLFFPQMRQMLLLKIINWLYRLRNLLIIIKNPSIFSQNMAVFLKECVFMMKIIIADFKTVWMCMCMYNILYIRIPNTDLRACQKSACASFSIDLELTFLCFFYTWFLTEHAAHRFTQAGCSASSTETYLYLTSARITVKYCHTSFSSTCWVPRLRCSCFPAKTSPQIPCSIFTFPNM